MSLGLTRYLINLSETPLERDNLKNTHQIINCIWEQHDSTDFRVPVDWKGTFLIKAYQLMDYLQVVKNPMDLGTIKKNMANNKYKLVEQVLNDIQLIWDNCKLYNHESSFIWKLADKLEKLFRRAIKNFLPFFILKPMTMSTQPKPQAQIQQAPIHVQQIQEPIIQQIQLPDPEEIYYQNRLNFAYKLKQLEPDQLTLMVETFKQECPLCYREYEKDKCMILVDQMPQDLVQKWNKRIDTFTQVTDSIIKKIKIY